jgi:hypothetical protein
VFRRWVNPILGLVALLVLPALGIGNRADAGFTVGLTTKTADRTETATPDDEQPLNDHGELPLFKSFVRLAPTDCSSTGSQSSSPSGATGTGLTCMLNSPIRPTSGQPSGRTLLATERSEAPPIASRLFRPPR